MLRNYLTIALRGLLRQRLYTTLNVVGLAVGMAFCLLALLYARHERSFDAFHGSANRLFLVRTAAMEPGANPVKTSANTPGRLAPVLVNHVPEIEAVVRFTPVGFVGRAVRVGRDRQVLDLHGLFADANLFAVFDFPAVAGNLTHALDEPTSVVLSRETAAVYFGDADPLDRALTIWRGEARDYIVTAVVDVPANSSIRFDFLLSTQGVAPDAEPWEQANYQTFALLRPGVDAADLAAKLSAFLPRYAGARQVSVRDWSGFGAAPIELIPITDLHLRHGLRWDLGETSNPAYSQIVVWLAVSVLVIAGVNFANLAIGMATSRAREVGVRKVLGDTRTHLMGRFWSESLLLSGAAMAAAVAITEALLPAFGALVERGLEVDYTRDWPLLIGVAAVTGVVAGAYPALVLSAFTPTEVLGRRVRLGGTHPLGRVLVVLQFAFSIALVAAAALMTRQIDYLKTRDLGFEAEGAILLDAGDGRAGLRRLLETCRSEGIGRHGLVGVSATNIAYGMPCCEGRRIYSRDGTAYGGTYFDIDHDLVSTLGLRVVEGRDFSRDRLADETSSLLVNEAMVRFLGWDTAVGRKLPSAQAGRNLTGDKTVIGVVGDFHYEPLQRDIRPAVFHLSPRSPRLRYLVARVQPGRVVDALAFLEEKWRSVLADRPFVYTFLDEEAARSLRSETRWQTICRSSAWLAITIACLGVFGLSALAAEQRTKEIGIRKAMGATVLSLVSLLNREFTWLVLAADVIAWPAAWLVLQRWLADYAYRVDLGWGVFAGGGAAALVLAWLAASWEATRAARANPVDALRYE